MQREIKRDIGLSTKPINAEQKNILNLFAEKYIWWKTAEEAALQPERVAAQVMNLGDYDDVQLLVNCFGDEYLQKVLTHAEAGWFTERSWVYWHYRLGASLPGQAPHLPQRKLA